MTETHAFLFYSQDFLVGTLALPMEDRGKYITLLCYMHAHGRLTEEIVTQLVGEISNPLRAKFKTDEQGLWYNQRLEKEIKDRQKFVESRRKNGKRGGRPKTRVTVTTINESRAALVKTDFMALGLSAIEAEYETLKFMAHYTAKDWKTIRGFPVTDLKAAVANWLSNRNQFQKNKQSKTLTEQWLA